VNEECINKLKLKLLKTKESKFDALQVNFDPALVRLLKEVK